MRIAIARFSHETCTFSPEPTTYEKLESRAARGEAVLEDSRGVPSYINGYMRVLQKEEAEIVPVLSVGMVPGPYTSWWPQKCFDRYADELAGGLAEIPRLDGVLLALHGAMAVRGVPRPEAEIVRRVKRAAGGVPVMVTLDLHANEDHELTDAADGVFVIKTYPHVDSQETGEIATRCLIDTIAGRFEPTMSLRRPGIASASIFQASDYHPMKTLYDRCRCWEQESDVYCVSVAPGYAYADVVDMGMSVIAVTDGDRSLAEEVAEDVSQLACSIREDFHRPLPGPEDGVAEVLQLVEDGQTPVVIADGADRTGDSTHILQQLLRQGAENFALPGLADPKAAKKLRQEASVGDTVSIKAGGWASEYSGEPVLLTGEVKYMGCPRFRLVGPMRRGAEVQDGFVVRLDLGANRQVVISERMRGSNDSAGLTSVGIDVDSLDIIVLKDRVHHRAYWDDVAAVDFPVDAPGLGPADLTTLQYENIPPDLYPVGENYRENN